MTIYDRIRIKTIEKGMKITEVEQALELGRSSLAKYTSAKPGKKTVQKLADFFGVSPDWLLYGDQPELPQKAPEEHRLTAYAKELKSTMIPVLGRVAAGEPLFAEDNIIDMVELAPSLAKNGEYFGLIIRGDSMLPKICDGDTVVIRQQPDAESGEIVIALVGSEEATCKKLIKTDSGILLQPLNPMYDPIVSDQIKILGKVVELRRKF